MPEAVQAQREIARQGPHVNALAAIHFEDRMIGIGQGYQVEAIDSHPARRHLGRVTLPRQLISPLTVHLDGGVYRRRLIDVTGEVVEHGANLRLAGTVVTGADNHAFGVVRIARLAPGHGEAISLDAIHRIGGGLGGFAQGDGQDARGHGIEGAAMTGLHGVGRLEHPRHGARRCHTRRLIQIEPTVDRPPAALPTPHRHRRCRPAWPGAAARRSCWPRRRRYRPRTQRTV